MKEIFITEKIKWSFVFKHVNEIVTPQKEVTPAVSNLSKNHLLFTVYTN